MKFSVVATLCAWLFVPLQGHAEQAFGRLFFTPEQRDRMDVARQHQRSVRFDDEERIPQSQNIRLNGVITRSDGQATVWINNRIQREPSQTVAVGKGGEVRVVTPDAKRNVRLKVGQTLDMGSGKVEEAYRRMPPVNVSGKEKPSALTSPGVEKMPAFPDRKDEVSTDVEGEAPSPR